MPLPSPGDRANRVSTEIGDPWLPTIPPHECFFCAILKHFSVGQKLSAQLVEVDPKRSEAKLSLSRLAQDEERKAHRDYQAKVKAESKFGTLGDLLKQKLGGG